MGLISLAGCGIAALIAYAFSETADVPSDVPEILGDIDRMEQMLMNIVGNAIKFTKSGSVTVAARSEGDSVRISVRDTGIGIPPEALPRIFNPFEQADSSITRAFGGTGLGLYIVYNLVTQQLRGTIQCESAPNRGATFIITLPLEGLQWPDETRQPGRNENGG